MSQLKGNELERLHAALLSAYPRPDDFATVVIFALGKGLDVISSQAKDHTTRVLEAIQYADSQDRIPALIAKAIDLNQTAKTLRSQGTMISERISRVSEWPEPDDPYDVCFVEDEYPFVNRTGLRDFFRNYKNPAEPAVCIVNGPDESGKTYSVRLIRYLKSRRVDFDLAHIDLKEVQSHTQYSPESLIRDIVRQSKWGLEPPSRASAAAKYGEELVRWLIGQANARALPLVVVLDNFHEPQLYGETRELVQNMIVQISELPKSEPQPPKLRLVLLKYPRELEPVELPGPVRRENATELTKIDVASFFTAFTRQLGKKLPNGGGELFGDFVWTRVNSESCLNDQVRLKILEAARMFL